MQITDANNLFKISKIKNNKIPQIIIWKLNCPKISMKKNCEFRRLKKQEIKKKKKGIFPLLNTIFLIKWKIFVMSEIKVFLFHFAVKSITKFNK